MGRGGDFFFAFYICKHFIHDFFFLFTNVNFTFINVQAGTRRPPRRARLAAGQTRSAAERMAAANAPRQRATPYQGGIVRTAGQTRSAAERMAAGRACRLGRGGRCRGASAEGRPLPGRKRGGGGRRVPACRR